MYSPLSQAMDAITVELGLVSLYVPEDMTCFPWIFTLAWSIVPVGSVLMPSGQRSNLGTVPSEACRQ